MRICRNFFGPTYSRSVVAVFLPQHFSEIFEFWFGPGKFLVPNNRFNDVVDCPADGLDARISCGKSVPPKLMVSYSDRNALEVFLG